MLRRPQELCAVLRAGGGHRSRNDWQDLARSCPALRGSGYNGAERRGIAGGTPRGGFSSGVVLRAQACSGTIVITLGINYSQMHDSSACIVRDGELLFAVAEERLSRVKHDARFPHLGVKACLDSASLKAEEVDYVCLG